MYHMDASLSSTAADIKTIKDGGGREISRGISEKGPFEQLTEADFSDCVLDKFTVRHPEHEDASCHKEEELQHKPQ